MAARPRRTVCLGKTIASPYSSAVAQRSRPLRWTVVKMGVLSGHLRNHPAQTAGAGFAYVSALGFRDRGAFGKSAEARDDAVDLGIFFVEVPTRPLDHVLVLLMIGIGERFKKFLVAPRAADVLRRTGTRGLQQP